MAEAAKARPVAAGERDKAESSAPSGPGFVLKVKKPHELAKTILEVVKAVGAVVAIVLGATAMATKSPVQDVVKVEQKVEAVELQVSGKTDQKGASSDGESLKEQVAILSKLVRPLVDNDCARRQVQAQILARLEPPIIVRVEGCPPAAPISVTVEPPLPGRRGKGAIVVHTPLP